MIWQQNFKKMLRKQFSQLGMQWDITYLPGVLWAYPNMPYSSNGKKASFLLFGFDCCHPTEAVVLPKKSLNAAKVMDYQEKLVLSLSSVKALQ